MSVVIRGTGSELPQRELTNAQLEQLVQTSDEWITSRTGIRTRHVVGPDEATSDLATRAGRRALDAAGIQPADLDLIVVATLTPDTLTPSTANLVQHNLCPGLGIPSFDLNAACSGFLYGLQVCSALIAAGAHRRILLIGAESMSRFMDYEDRSVCILFGDGAGAVVLENRTGPGGLLDVQLGSDGGNSGLIVLPGGGSRRPASPAVLERREQYLRMNGNRVFKFAVQSMEQIARDTLKRVGWSTGDVTWLLAHQANQRILDAVGERLAFPPERMLGNLERTGNTSAASIPLLLDESVRAGRIRPGDRLLLVAFGAGLTWGAAAIEWTT
jgi:3-oxoacyl-[acyl-carrier-protein] synthase-3